MKKYEQARWEHALKFALQAQALLKKGYLILNEDKEVITDIFIMDSINPVNREITCPGSSPIFYNGDQARSDYEVPLTEFYERINKWIAVAPEDQRRIVRA